MPYITSVEQIGHDRGLVEGRAEAAQQSLERVRSLILKQLTRKVGTIPNSTSDLINTLSITQLESLGEALLDFVAIADLITWLDHQN